MHERMCPQVTRRMLALVHACATLVQRAEALLLQVRRGRLLIMPLKSPLRRDLRPSSSPEIDAHAEMYLASALTLSELSVPPLSGSRVG